MLASKLGYHAQQFSQKVQDVALKSRARVWKTLVPDGVDFYLACKRQWPMFIVGRRPDLAEQIDWADPEKSADEAADLVIEWAQRCPHVDAWEGRNEVIINDADPEIELDKARAYARHEIRFRKRLAEAGYRATTFQFSAGNPFTLELWSKVLWEALVDLEGCPEAINNQHGYSQPSMEVKADWLTLRYRKVQGLLPQRARKPVLLSEVGIDGGIWVDGMDPPKPRVGWQGYCGKDEYVRQLKWFDQELQRDPYVMGATVFDLEAA